MMLHIVRIYVQDGVYLTLRWGMAGICKWRKLHFKDPLAPQMVIIITQAKKLRIPHLGKLTLS